MAFPRHFQVAWTLDTGIFFLVAPNHPLNRTPNINKIITDSQAPVDKTLLAGHTTFVTL